MTCFQNLSLKNSIIPDVGGPTLRLRAALARGHPRNRGSVYFCSALVPPIGIRGTPCWISSPVNLAGRIEGASLVGPFRLPPARQSSPCRQCWAAFGSPDEKNIEYSNSRQENTFSSLSSAAPAGLSSGLVPASEGDPNLAASLLSLASALSKFAESVSELSVAVGSVAESIRPGNSSASEISAGVGSDPSVAQGPGPLPENDVTTNENELPTPFTEESVSTALKMGFRLQRAFAQARIDGLGKPSELAIEEFVLTCMEAEAQGLGLPELQLQLIMAVGKLPSAFSPTAKEVDESNLPPTEEGRVSTMWVRLVYTTLAQARQIVANGGMVPQGDDLTNPTDVFVQETIDLVFKKGNDLATVLGRQKQEGPPTSPAIKTLRQSQLVILFTFHHVMNASD